MVNSINTNLAAYYAQANIGIASQLASNSVAKLSSGRRFVRASDDVAALSISTSLATSVATLKIAKTNAAQGATLLQIADGALAQITEILQRQKAIAIQAGSGSLSDTDRGFLDQEFQSLVSEIDRITTSTNFNNVNLIDGSLSGVGGNFLTDDPAAETDYTVNKIGDSSSDAVISAVAVVAPVDATNGLNPNVIGAIENVTFANVGAADDGTAIRMRMTINGVLFEGVTSTAGLDTTDNAETATFLLTEVGTEFNDTDGATNDPMQISVTVQEHAVNAGLGIAAGTAAVTLAAFMAGYGDDTKSILEGSYISQTRLLSADVSDASEGTALQGIADGAIAFETWTMDTLLSDSFGSVDSVSVTKVGDDEDDNGQINVRINGKDFQLFDLNGATASTDGILTAADSLTLTATDGETQRTETITIDLTGLDATINLNTENGALALENALRTVLAGQDSSSTGGLSFQVGANSSDSLNVSIAAADTDALYDGATLNVLTQDSAETASTALEAALHNISAIRAGVGAAQSRFNFAQANIDSAVQNQDAARAELADTDIASESTNFATAQVRLQAGISVLAQANQQLQSLLKLIG